MISSDLSPASRCNTLKMSELEKMKKRLIKLHFELDLIS